MVRIELDDNHIYRVNGRIYPGVTEIIESEGFADYSALDYKPSRDPRFETLGEETRYRGHWVHRACALLFQDRLRWESLQSSPAWIGYVQSCLLALKAYSIVPLLIEQIFFNVELGYCGTIDLLCIIEDWYVVLDLKTGAREPWHRLQTGGYRRGIPYLPEALYPWKDQAHRRATLSLFGDGSIGKLSWHDDVRDLDWFAALVKIHYARKELYG